MLIFLFFFLFFVPCVGVVALDTPRTLKVNPHISRPIYFGVSRVRSDKPHLDVSWGAEEERVNVIVNYSQKNNTCFDSTAKE